MTDGSRETRRTLKLVRQPGADLWASADGRWVVNTRTGEQTYDGVPLELNYWEEREIWARDVDGSALPDQPELSGIYLGPGRPVGFVGRNESASDAVDRMWGRLCVGEPAAVLPCGCAYWQTKRGGYYKRSPCPLTFGQHLDCLNWLGFG